MFARLKVYTPEHEMRGKKSGLLFQEREEMPNAAVVLSCVEVAIGGTHVEHQRERIMFARARLRRLRFLEAAHGVEKSGVPMMRGGVAWIEFNRAEELFLGAGPIPFVPEARESQRSVRLAKRGINFDSTCGARRRLGAGRSRRQRTEPAKQIMTIRDPGEGARAARLDRQGGLKRRDSFL